MAKAAEIKTKLTGDATGLKRELASAKSEVGKYARDVTERLKAITAAVQSINIIAQVSAIVGIAKQAVELYKTLKNWIDGAGKAARASAEEAEAAAKKLADAASKTGFSPAQFAAIQEAAAKANVPAEQLNSILAEIAKKGGGLQEVADALGTTADNLERGAAAAGRAYTAARDARKSTEAAAASAAAADAAGIREMVNQLLDNDSDLDTVVADVFSAFKDIPHAFDTIMDAVAAEYERRRSAARGPEDGPLAGATGWTMEEGERWAAQDKFRSTRDVATVAGALEMLFDAVAKQTRRKQEREADDAKRAWAAGVIGAGIEEYNPYDAYAEEERRQAAEKAAAEKAAADLARRNARHDDLLRQMGEASAKRAEDIAAITVSAPQAINSLNTIGGLLGNDPSKMNAMRMDEERNRKMDDITQKFDAANEKLQKAVDALTEG